MIGQFAVSKAGHDKGTVYVVIAQDDKYLYVSDGRLKSVEQPKKKSRKHMQPVVCKQDAELTEKLLKGEKVYPEQIRLAIKKYLEKECN